MSVQIPEVYLFICLDHRIPPGATLHALDLLRAQDWQKEIVLLCDKSWEPYVTVEQPALFLDRKSFFHESSMSQSSMVNIQALEAFLEQLDGFDIKQVLQLGELSWGRWINAYISEIGPNEQKIIKVDSPLISAVEVVNLIADEFGLDLTIPQKEDQRNSQLYVDPYSDGKLSNEFVAMVENSVDHFPLWANIIVKEEDQEYFNKLGFDENLVDFEETNSQLFNQYILCFDESSPFAQASRAYNVALYTKKDSKASSAFVPGDIVISSDESIHLTEMVNLMSYWKRNRLKELAFQWVNMGIEIQVVENFHHRITKRKIQSYASDLLHCQTILQKFNHNNPMSERDINDFVRFMRKTIDNDPYALSFSLKILLMITERMLASASCGERIFQRLGSDYHRIIIW